MIKNSRVYDVLKFMALVVLPAVATLYFTLAGIWDLPKAQEVVNTIVAVDTFLGVVLQISNAGYSSAKVGDIVPQEQPGGGKTFTLRLNEDAEKTGQRIEDHDEVRFSVAKGDQALAQASRHRTGKRRHRAP